jgi:hypothetical protein
MVAERSAADPIRTDPPVLRPVAFAPAPTAASVEGPGATYAMRRDLHGT